MMVTVFLLGCQNAPPHTLAGSEEIARTFITDAPTYAYGGSTLELQESNTLRCDDCFIHIYSFTSSHAGYGNRSSEVVAQVLTSHTASVIVQEDRIIQAIIDNEWNEIRQRKIESYEQLDQGSSRTPVYYCADPRPTECGVDDEPVCTSTRKDFPTPCHACADATMKWYTKGDCNLGYTENAINDLSRAKLSKEGTTLMILIDHSN